MTEGAAWPYDGLDKARLQGRAQALPDCEFPPEKEFPVNPLSMHKLTITLLIPGFSPDFCQFDEQIAQPAKHPLQSLACQSGLPPLPWEAQLMRLLGDSEAIGERLPTARLLAGDQHFAEGVVCAAPVHLRADRDTATLLPAATLALTEQESDELIDSLNRFVEPDGLCFSRKNAELWFLKGLDAAHLSSFPPSYLANRKASSYLPHGDNTEGLRRLMTEIQMLLHTHPVNLAREGLGKLPTNSLWFWGGAELPRTPAGLASITVFGDDDFAQRLAHHWGVTCVPLNAFADHAEGHAVVVDTGLMYAALALDEAGVQEARERVMCEWLQPWCDRIDEGLTAEIQLLNDDGDRVFYNAALAREQRNNQRFGARFKGVLDGRFKRVLQWFNRADSV